MYSLLVTIIAIALVALVALATLYYGGTIFNTGAEAAHAAKLDAQGQQVMGALELYKADTGAYPHTMEDLVTSQYLRSIPVSLSPDTHALASALASTTTWLIAADGQPVIVTQPVSVATCSAFNKLNLGVAGVLAVVHSSALRQCYGTDSANLTVLISKSGIDTLYVAGLPTPAVSIGAVLTTPVPPATDTTANGWSVLPGAAAPAAAVLSYAQSGTGIAALAFGSASVGSSSAPLSVTVTNTGTVAAALTGATASAPFAVSGNTCIGSLAAGASCTVSVAFTPASAQAYAGGAYALTLTASNGTLASLPLTGTGASTSSLSLSESAVAFPPTNSGDYSAALAQPVITNISSGIITLASFDAGSSNDFYADMGDCGLELAPGAFCTLYAEWDPHTGEPSATATLVSSAGTFNVQMASNQTPVPPPAGIENCFRLYERDWVNGGSSFAVDPNQYVGGWVSWWTNNFVNTCSYPLTVTAVESPSIAYTANSLVSYNARVPVSVVVLPGKIFKVRGESPFDVMDWGNWYHTLPAGQFVSFLVSVKPTANSTPISLTLTGMTIGY